MRTGHLTSATVEVHGAIARPTRARTGKESKRTNATLRICLAPPQANRSDSSSVSPKVGTAQAGEESLY